MAGSFKRVGNDRVRVRLGNDEVAVLRGLPDQLRTVLGEGEDEPAGTDGNGAGDLDVADIEHDAEYHRLMHDDLVKEKLANLDLVTSTLARGSSSVRRWTVELTDDEATAWLGVLNDLRLALGVRLDITRTDDGHVDDTAPRAPALRLLSYLGWLEEQLLDALQRYQVRLAARPVQPRRDCQAATACSAAAPSPAAPVAPDADDERDREPRHGVHEHDGADPARRVADPLQQHGQVCRRQPTGETGADGRGAEGGERGGEAGHVLEDRNREQIYEIAKKKQIPVRSKIGKWDLIKAIRAHR